MITTLVLTCQKYFSRTQKVLMCSFVSGKSIFRRLMRGFERNTLDFTRKNFVQDITRTLTCTGKSSKIEFFDERFKKACRYRYRTEYLEACRIHQSPVKNRGGKRLFILKDAIYCVNSSFSPICAFELLCLLQLIFQPLLIINRLRFHLLHKI